MSDLMPVNAEELKIDHVGGISQALADPLTAYEPEQKAVVVYLYRELDGWPGPKVGGSKRMSSSMGGLRPPRLSLATLGTIFYDQNDDNWFHPWEMRSPDTTGIVGRDEGERHEQHTIFLEP